MKTSWKPGTVIYPLPAILVSCGADGTEYNMMTASWVGTICSDPPMCYVSLRPERHSYEIIKRTGEFVLNLTNEEMAFATDWCGVRSGKDCNKFVDRNIYNLSLAGVHGLMFTTDRRKISFRSREILLRVAHSAKENIIAMMIRLDVSLYGLYFKIVKKTR